MERSYLLAQQHSQSELFDLLRSEQRPPLPPSLGVSSLGDLSSSVIFPTNLDEARRQGVLSNAGTLDRGSPRQLSEEDERAEGTTSLIWPQPAALMDDGFPRQLPALIAQLEDKEKLSAHQVLLRHQIEAFQATDDDVATHTRGRNKPISLKQGKSPLSNISLLFLTC